MFTLLAAVQSIVRVGRWFNSNRGEGMKALTKQSLAQDDLVTDNDLANFDHVSAELLGKKVEFDQTNFQGRRVHVTVTAASNFNNPDDVFLLKREVPISLSRNAETDAEAEPEEQEEDYDMTKHDIDA